jgi:hypothetical protein
LDKRADDEEPGLTTTVNTGAASWSRHSRLMRVWWSLWVWILLCGAVPMRYTVLKIGLLLGSVAMWGLTMYLFRRTRWVRMVCGVAAIIAAGLIVFLMLPGRPYDVCSLRREYVRSLLSYRGTPYVWGGGNRLGIDCSGLVEQALTDALIKRAVTTGNPRLAREGLSLWWHNRSAHALGDGYRGDTLLLMEGGSLNTIDHRAIEPGDLAVAADGVHVLAHVGSQNWIEADPAPMRVVVVHSPRPTDYYFDAPVRIMRWRVLR